MNHLTIKNYILYIFFSAIFLFLIGTVNAQQSAAGGKAVSETDIVGSMNFPQQQQHDYPSYQPLSVDDIEADSQVQQFESDYEVSRQKLRDYKTDGSYFKLKKQIIDQIKSNRAGVGNRGNQDNASANENNRDSSENNSQANNSQEGSDEDKKPESSDDTAGTRSEKKPSKDTNSKEIKKLNDKLFSIYEGSDVNPDVIKSIAKLGKPEITKYIINNPDKIARLDKETQMKIAKEPKYLLEIFK